ncbi:MAG TPA: AAA family ATPase, partial [Candidatus Limnocylindrales bacterium]|nr:AAA family ATPase [Candidatus Limnocylindrales bacterium]
MPSARQTSIIGRDDEVRAVQAFVADAGGPPRSLAIAGAAGMGKTLLWRSAVDTARAGGSLVLIARATERELDLPYAALADLIGRLAEAHGAALPDLQRSAIAAVLLQADPNVALDVRTVGTAVVAMLERAVASRPVLIAIDDEPWIDAASRETLRFAIRRLPDRARLLVTRRTPFDDASSGLGDALPADSRTRIELQSLSAAALHDMLRERLGAAPARPALTRITDVSAGNPFFALELARAATTSGAEPSGFFDPMTIPASLRELMSARLAALGDRARLVLTAIAALDRPSPATIGLVLTERGEPAQSVDQDLEQLERDRLIVFDDDLRVSHPLITEIVLDDLGPGRRRLLHRLLAGIVTDEDQVARHLALGTIDPAEPIA